MALKVPKTFRPATKKQIREQLIALGFVKTSDDYFKSRDFYARILTIKHPTKQQDGSYLEQDVLTLQLSWAKTFDRWANSVDFKLELNHIRREWLNIKQAVKKARKIARSGLFDFNTYFHAIELDGF